MARGSFALSSLHKRRSAARCEHTGAAMGSCCSSESGDEDKPLLQDGSAPAGTAAMPADAAATRSARPRAVSESRPIAGPPAKPRDAASSAVAASFVETPPSSLVASRSPRHLSASVTSAVSATKALDGILLCVLCGLPGSGKSTAAELLEERGWYVINQDRLKRRTKCERAAAKALTAGGRIVIDRTNIDVNQRATWLSILRTHCLAHGITPEHVASRACCVYFDIPPVVCKERVLGRKNHPTLPAEQRSLGVIDQFASTAVIPTAEEGFGSGVIVVSHDAALDKSQDAVRIASLLQALLCLPCPFPAPKQARITAGPPAVADLREAAASEGTSKGASTSPLVSSSLATVTGTVKSFDAKRRFGYIVPDLEDGSPADMSSDGIVFQERALQFHDDPVAGDRVRFKIRTSRKPGKAPSCDHVERLA
eukprot:m.25390 g.25390  ORF g.25390 m.25390 type:complete len:426 (-) comp4426_c0_seq1:170-1447(-)